MSEEIKQAKTKRFWLGSEKQERYITCHYLGDIKLGEHVHISDPCYSRDEAYRTELCQVKPGLYRVYTFHNGARVHMLMLLHAEKYGPWQFFVRWHKGEDVVVDSGQMGVFDDSIYPMGQDNGEDEDPNSFYRKCCTATLSKEKVGLIDGAGAVTSSGYGDGEYWVFTNPEASKNAILIDYLSETIDETVFVALSMSDP